MTHAKRSKDDARLHYSQDPDRDRPLGYHWRTDPDALRVRLGLPECRTPRGDRVIASIVTDACLCAKTFPGRRISYSRRAGWWSMAPRYLGSDYSFRTVVPVVDALAEAGLFIEHRIEKGSYATGTQSSFLPSPKLAAAHLPPVSADPGELIRLKDGNGHLVDYRDTERTSRDRRLLAKINDMIAASRVWIDGRPADEDGIVRFEQHAVNSAATSLYAVYNGGWERNGRMYGGWWQQVPKEERLRIRIDNEEAAELDYAMLHPRLLYALAGQKMDLSDAYRVRGTREERRVVKRAFNILLNAASRGDAVGALSVHVEGSFARSSALIRAVTKAHPKVARYFHTGIGLTLQHADSRIARNVLSRLQKRGIVALPIHDSFVVKRRHIGHLQEAMDTAYEEGITRLERLS